MRPTTSIAAAIALSLGMSGLFAAPALAGHPWGGHKGHDKDHHKMHGRMHGKMHGKMHGEVWAGPEVAYLTGMQLGATGLAAGGPTGIVIGRTRQWQLNDFFSLGGASGMAIQTPPAAATTGPWLTPYWGFLPRVGLGLGPIRCDLGVLAGGGGMIRTTSVGTQGDFLQARLTWLLEPRIEIGFRGEHMGGGVTASYLLTPNMADLGGLTVGGRLTFGGAKSKGHDDAEDADAEDDDDDDESDEKK